MPNFNFKSQFPIAEVIAAAQKKPMLEAQMAQEKEQMRQARFKTLLDALSTGAQVSRLSNQNKNDALQRQQTQTQMQGQQQLQQEVMAPPQATPVAPPIQQFQRAQGPAMSDGMGPAPVPANVVQPTFGGTEYGANQPGRLQAALLKAFPEQAGAQFAQRQFADPLDQELKQAQINNVGVDNQLAAARLLEDQRKNNVGIANDKEKLAIDREKLRIDRQKLKLDAATTGTKLTDVQANALLFGERAGESNQQLEQAISAGFDPTSLGTTVQKWLPNRLHDDQVQMFEQSKLNFVSAVLRKESGAAISPSEWETATKQYFPADGDSEATLSQKKKNRETAIGGLLRQGGKQGQEIMDRFRSSTKSDTGGGVPAVGGQFNGGTVISVEPFNG